jgi:hypothetical protein
VVGVADLSPVRILMGSAACALGWFLGSVIFGVWMELGVGAWLIAGAFLGAAFGACRAWWTAISAMLLYSDKLIVAVLRSPFQLA